MLPVNRYRHPAAIRKCKKAITKAFRAALDKKGTSFVEVVSTCNMNWKMTPVKANEWMEANMFPFYKPGDLKDSTKERSGKLYPT